MSVLSSILGGGDVLKAGMQLIDSIHTSDVEIIEAKTKAKTDLLSAYAPFKVAQRYIALLFGFTYIGSFLLLLSITLYQGVNMDSIRVLLDEFYIGPIMLVIVSFYFGGGAFEGGMTASKKLFPKKDK